MNLVTLSSRTERYLIPDHLVRDLPAFTSTSSGSFGQINKRFFFQFSKGEDFEQNGLTEGVLRTLHASVEMH